MTDSISEPNLTNLGNTEGAQGPDPVIGAGITLLGIFIMGLAGARDAHYAFDLGVLTGVVGAGIFVLFVALSVMRLRKVEAAARLGEPSNPPAG